MKNKELPEKRINDKIAQIKEFCGLSLQKDDYFTGIKKHQGKEYFNVELNERLSFCNSQFRKLESLIKKGIISDVKENGVRRVSIYF